MRLGRIGLTLAAGATLAAAAAIPASAGVPQNIQEVSATNAGLPLGNTLNGFASAPVGSSTFTGSFGDSDGTNSYEGSVVCVAFDGATHNASMLLSIATPPANAPNVVGAVYWLHDGASSATLDGQRNSLLGARQFDRFAGTCPDPNSPPHGTFKSISGGDIFVGVVNPST
jgi:hypothetical protein